MLAMVAFAISSAGGNARIARAESGVPSHFVVTVGGPVTAGVPFTVTVTAQDTDNVTVTSFDGSNTILTDLLTSPGCGACAPEIAPVGPGYGSGTWADGVGTYTVTAYRAQSDATIVANSGSPSVTGTSDPFVVAQSATPGGITIDEIASPQTAGGSGIDVTVRAYDLYGNVDLLATGGDLSGLTQDSPGCTACSPAIPTAHPTYGTIGWAAGVGTGSVNAVYAGSGEKIHVAIGDLANDSNAFNVVHSATAGGVTIDTIGTQTAGTAFTATLHAFDEYGNTNTSAAAGTLSGLAPSPGCADCAPPFASVPATATAIAWTSGVGTSTVTAVTAQTGASIHAVVAGKSSDSNGFTVNHSAVEGGITIDPITSPQTAGGSGIAVTVNAFDEFGNVNTDASGGALSGLAANSPGCASCSPAVPVAHPTYPASLTWASGVGTGNVNAVMAKTGEKIHAVVGTKSNDSNTFTVNHSATAGGVTIGTVGAQVAGTGFTVTTHAFDEYGNVNTDASGGSLSGLAGSLGCAGCAPVIASIPADHGTIVWTSGTGAATVTAVKAQNGASISASVLGTTNISNTFNVAPAGLSQLVFANTTVDFNGQPIDTKFSQPINSVCGPYVPAQPTATNPCAVATSTPTKVLAVDAYGNRVSGIGITISSTATGVAGTLTGTTAAGSDPTLAPYGEAIFGNLKITPIASYTLKATSGAVNRTSDAFNIVNDMAACDNQLCTNNGDNGGNNQSLQRAYGRIKTGTANDFYVPGNTNVLLTTKFAASSGPDGPDAKCGSNSSIGQATDLQIGGTGFSITSKTTMVFITPKDTLKADGVTSRGTPSFNICLGASVLSGNPAPWTQKSGQPAASINGRYWGTPPDCTTALLNSGNPCVSLRSKQAAPVKSYLGLNNADFAKLGIKDADLVMIVELGYPWDSKGGTY
jgi:hypothetical protein